MEDSPHLFCRWRERAGTFLMEEKTATLPDIASGSSR